MNGWMTHSVTKAWPYRLCYDSTDCVKWMNVSVTIELIAYMTEWLCECLSEWMTDPTLSQLTLSNTMLTDWLTAEWFCDHR